MEPKWAELKMLPDEAGPFDRVRSAALQELKRSVHRRRWHGDVAIFSACTLGLTVLAALVLNATTGLADGGLVGHLSTLAPLVLAQIVGAWAAMAPRAKALQFSAIALSAASMASVVLLRGDGHPSDAPQLVCTLGHLGLAGGPLILALVLLQRASITGLRAVVAGAAAGAVGASLGELGCGQGALHVALFHLPAWLASMSLAWALSRKLRPESFAP